MFSVIWIYKPEHDKPKTYGAADLLLAAVGATLDMATMRGQWVRDSGLLKPP